MSVSIKAVQNGWVVEVSVTKKTVKKPNVIKATVKGAKAYKGAKASVEQEMEMDMTDVYGNMGFYSGIGPMKALETHVFSFNEKPAMMKLIGESLVECPE